MAQEFLQNISPEYLTIAEKLLLSHSIKDIEIKDNKIEVYITYEDIETRNMTIKIDVHATITKLNNSTIRLELKSDVEHIKGKKTLITSKQQLLVDNLENFVDLDYNVIKQRIEQLKQFDKVYDELGLKKIKPRKLKDKKFEPIMQYIEEDMNTIEFSTLCYMNNIPLTEEELKKYTQVF